MEGRSLKTLSDLQKSEGFLIPGEVKLRFFSADHPLKEEEKNRIIDNIVEISKSFNVILQAFDSNRTYGKRHLISSLYHALRSREREITHSRETAVDVVRYAAGERQIHLAFEKVGIRENTQHIAVLVYSPQKVMADIMKVLSDIMMRNGLKETEEKNVKREDELEALERTALLDLKL